MIINTLLQAVLILSYIISHGGGDIKSNNKKVKITYLYRDEAHNETLSKIDSQRNFLSRVLHGGVQSIGRTRSYIAFDGVSHLSLSADHLKMKPVLMSTFSLVNYSSWREKSISILTRNTLNRHKIYYDAIHPVHRRLYISGELDSSAPLVDLTKPDTRRLPFFISNHILIANKLLMLLSLAQASDQGQRLTLTQLAPFTLFVKLGPKNANVENLNVLRFINLSTTSNRIEVAYLPHVISIPSKYRYNLPDRIQQSLPQPVLALAVRTCSIIQNIPSRYYENLAAKNTKDLQGITHQFLEFETIAILSRALHPLAQITTHRAVNLVNVAGASVSAYNSLKIPYCSIKNACLPSASDSKQVLPSFKLTNLSSLRLDYRKAPSLTIPALRSEHPSARFNYELLLNIAMNTSGKIHKLFALNINAVDIQRSANSGTVAILINETNELILGSHKKLTFIINYIRSEKELLVWGVIPLVLIAFILYQFFLIRRLRTRECALNESVLFARAMCNEIPHPIYIRDRKGRLLDCNKSYIDALGVERHEVINKKIIDTAYFRGAQQAHALHTEYLKVLSTGMPSVFDYSTQTTDGLTLAVNHWVYPFKGNDGTMLGLVGGWDDVSEHRRLLADLSERKKHSDDANRAKSAFLATMSHEIRTPMSAVLGLLELALKKANQGVVDRISIEVAFNAANELLELIGDILDISRIESGGLPLNPARTSLKATVESIFRVFENSAKQKGLKLILDFHTACESDVMLDSSRFRQIISNLLSNAIKFTNAGEVRIKVLGTEDFDKHSLSLQVEVSDTGIGISEENQLRLFDPYVQANSENHSNLRSSGLGLAICRTLCEMMGGHLFLQSRLGCGTKVEIKLELNTLPPAPKINKLPLKPPPPTLTGQLRILVVDDYPANRLLIAHQLGYLGHQVIDVKNGVEGLDEWRNGDYDIIITDCNMPLMNGYELASAIREEELEKGRAPSIIIGLTANAQLDEKLRCIESGMNECLFKPLSLNDLATSLHIATKPSLTNAAMVLVSEKPQIEIDLTNLQIMTGGDDATILGLLNELISSNEEDMSRLTTLYLSYDLSGLSDLAHRIRGGARIINANYLVRCCEQLEAACVASDSVRLLYSMEALQTAMRELAVAIKYRMSR